MMHEAKYKACARQFNSFNSTTCCDDFPTHTLQATTARGAGSIVSAADASSKSAEPLAEPEVAEGAEVAELGLTENQCRLLYLVSLYTRPAKKGNEKEEWVRQQALMVILYEAIVAGVLDYDYAPAASLVQNRRVFFNKSQEGASDVDFLREEGLLNGLKLSSTHYQPITCYQISEKGQVLARKVPKKDKVAVQELVYAPGTRELLRVQWHQGKFLLVGAGGYERQSTVLDCEAVSYVGSAYIPQCLRFGGRPTMSNAHRAAECALAASTVRDELDEVITLNSVSIIVAEFIPFGANQIVQMNTTLGSAERVQGGFFTALMDNDSGGTKFVVDPGLTSVNILDYSSTRHINFEANISIPEGKGITQVETFGVSVNGDGTLFYGMQVEAIMDRIKDNISLDTLARLLVDVSADSSTIIDSVLSAYQRKMLNLVFDGDAPARDKCNLIVANEITPHLTAEEYMDKGEYENELKQVIGDTRAAFDISEHDTLIFGANGLLLAGPNARQHEPLLCSYMQFNALDLFTRSFFNRLFVLNDAMKQLRLIINAHAEDPTSVGKVYDRLQVLSDDVRLMGETLGYMAESLETCEIPPEPTDAAGRALYQRLQVADVAGQLSMRMLDLKKNLEGMRQELSVSDVSGWHEANPEANADALCLRALLTVKSLQSPCYSSSLLLLAAAPAPPSDHHLRGAPVQRARGHPVQHAPAGEPARDQREDGSHPAAHHAHLRRHPGVRCAGPPDGQLDGDGLRVVRGLRQAHDQEQPSE